MKRFKSKLFLMLVLGITVISAGCGSVKQNSTTNPKDEKAITLTISAAASLKDSMEDIKKLYSQEKPNVTITYNFGASGTLQQQIEQGAPADVFISAATKQMDALKKKGLLIDDTNKNLLENNVVLIAPKDSSTIKDFNDLATDNVKKIALGEPKSVPVGQYAQDVLTSLKIADKVQPKAVLGKDVKEVLTWVETGNVDAGIVYETDAKVSNKVNIVATAPENSHKPVVYPVAVLKDSKNVEAAKEFTKFLSEDKAKAVFEKYGFKAAK
ncbi:molybdate ABC transporter substrate-binding protein [Clostridium sp. DJ247]|uniref:molybdate ABC transporter substrate-binding protein n=1 Tax=Clostridium sp. DJ247 TaxID=2726188 RepID=UPI00162AE3F6|nr:molybdate ABC transporter substrate-binding protein [Clostridium sp. DJ247]MBC2579731.1 molybdate ABC transporter substrate-binding protein [Clostridium sp. DJ247]